MASTQLLTPMEVREFVSDYTTNNYLLDGEEFSDTGIQLCIDLAVDAFNLIPPPGSVTLANFPSKSLLLYGTLWHLFEGRAAVLARNTMAYSDGGLQIPIEERYELYMSMAGSWKQKFQEGAQQLKIAQNMAAGWGFVRSEESLFPMW
jgi:hypothetical protein